MNGKATDHVGGQAVESKTAARTAARLLLVAALVGALTGLATWLFVYIDHVGVHYLWEVLPEQVEGVPTWVVPAAVVVVTTLLATVVVAAAKRRPFDMGQAVAEYDAEGRISYQDIFSGTAFSLFSLFSGAAVGPEAPLTDINGGLGTWIADRLRLPDQQVRIMAYSGVAGAFSAFFGAAPVGALLAAELIIPKAANISRTDIVAGLSSGATAWVVYAMLGGQRVPIVLSFPALPELRLTDVVLALVLGVLGGVVGLVYGVGLQKTRIVTLGLRKRPWLAGLAGGMPVAIAAVVSPYLLFSGQAEVSRLIGAAATFTVLTLLALGIAKLALSAWCLSSAYFGGPIFPLIFAGTAFGLALNVALPGIPQGVAVMSIATGMVVAASAVPLSVTIFLGLMTDPTLLSVIAIAAVASYVVRQLIAPTLPG